MQVLVHRISVLQFAKGFGDDERWHNALGYDAKNRTDCSRPEQERVTGDVRSVQPKSLLIGCVLLRHGSLQAAKLKIKG